VFHKKLSLLLFLSFFLTGCLFKKKTASQSADSKKSASQGEFVQEGGTYIFSDDADEFSLDDEEGDQFTDNKGYVSDKDDFQWDNIVYDTDAGEVIQFDFDDTTVKPSEKTKIKHNVELAKQELKSNPNSKVAVKGHACKIAKSELYNRAISQERAENVAKEYANGGVPREKLNAVGFGSSELLTEDDGLVAQAPNRRVETDFILD
jgi:outer membrane protein OmpA-like peptidoglycan-associated protein